MENKIDPNTRIANEYCEYHGYEHGPLYICEYYSDERKKVLRDKQIEFKKLIQSGEMSVIYLDKTGKKIREGRIKDEPLVQIIYEVLS